MLFKVNPVPRLKCVLMAARLYAVDGHPDCYYRDGRFYRWHEGALESATKWNGPWKTIRCNVFSRAWADRRGEFLSPLRVILGRADPGF